jgi:hypothetical protein
MGDMMYVFIVRYGVAEYVVFNYLTHATVKEGIPSADEVARYVKANGLHIVAWY